MAELAGVTRVADRGRPVPAHLLETYRKLIQGKKLSKSAIARETRTSRTTLYKYFGKMIKSTKTPPPGDGQMPDGIP